MANEDRIRRDKCIENFYEQDYGMSETFSEREYT